MRKIDVACVLYGGDNYSIDVRGKTWYFELHPRLGPCRNTKKGNACDAPLPKYIYAAIAIWTKQGKRATEDNHCIYDEQEA